MSETRQFCPECGEPVPEDAPRGQAGTRRERSLCDACYFDRFDLADAPDRVEVLVCSGCGAVRRGDRWTDVGARDYTDVAVDAVSEELGVHADATDVEWGVEPEQVDATTVRMHCEFAGVVRGTALRETATVPVKLSKGTCDRCGRIAGDDFAAVVQVRATDRTPESEEVDRALDLAQSHVAEKEAAGDRNAYVTEIQRTDDGADVKLSTTGLGRSVATRIREALGGDLSESRTLVSEDEEGNPVYRMTYAVHLPPFTPGDVVDPGDGDGPVLVRSARGNLKGVRLASGDAYEASHEDGIAPDAERLGSRSAAVETTVVAVEDDHAVQVLDPETYAATTVARPDFFDPDADTVPVLKSDAGLHLLPEDG
ncbi:MAG: 60S ribosomal export protein NMD3 [Halobacteriaceae archaeon]